MDDCVHTTNGAWRATDGRFWENPSRRVAYGYDTSRQKELAKIIARLAPRAANQSPAVTMQAVVALRRRVDELEREAVALARKCSWSWRDVGDMLGITRSAAHRRFGKP